MTGSWISLTRTFAAHECMVSNVSRWPESWMEFFFKILANPVKMLWEISNVTFEEVVGSKLLICNPHMHTHTWLKFRLFVCRSPCYFGHLCMLEYETTVTQRLDSIIASVLLITHTFIFHIKKKHFWLTKQTDRDFKYCKRREELVFSK